MLKNLPASHQEIIAWSWPEMEHLLKELASRPLDAGNITEWLADWSAISEREDEKYARLMVATSCNTADRESEARLNAFLDEIYPPFTAAEEGLKEKLLASHLQPASFEIPLRNMRAEAELFRKENLELLAEHHKLSLQYDKLIGAQSVTWQGEETTLARLNTVFEKPDRALREQAWHLKARRQLADRQAINELWVKALELRRKIAGNAGKPSYREYAWEQKLRFDYSPQDSQSFAAAILEVVVPAATRIYRKRQQALGLDSLRPWDLVDGWHSRPTPPGGIPQLKPFNSIQELKEGISRIFNRMDATLGGYADAAMSEGLTDLDNRKNKAPGAFCASYTSIRKPFVFANSVGVHTDVMTAIHEFGHAFHVRETAGLPYIHQLTVPMEFAEVASTAMELLASPYLSRHEGGFYSAEETARARIEHLETMLLFWPFMAVVDLFQHWVYENPVEGAQPDLCDRKWAELWARFIPGVDYSGLEEVRNTGWHRKQHIHQVPFYYVEYGLAQLGAVQIYGNARTDHPGALAAYRKALSLGGTVTLPELFAAANAKFAFDAGTLARAVTLMETVIAELEQELN